MTEKIIICTYEKKFLPNKCSEQAVCWDLKISKNLKIKPNSLEILWTWIKTYLPIWWHAKIFARSSLPTKFGLMLANSTAIIDSDYRWEYLLQLFNFTKDIKKIEKYDRLAQLEFLPYFIDSWNFGTEYIPELEFIVDKKLYDNFENHFISKRWKWWLGSTGKK
jgi:dUTP pyrophosphatase